MRSKPHIHSPLQVTYDDLILSVKERIDWMKRNYPRMIAEGRIQEWSATHNAAVEEAKLRLLKKFKQDPQTNLFNEFEKMKS